jgi:hypothetical protein
MTMRRRLVLVTVVILSLAAMFSLPALVFILRHQGSLTSGDAEDPAAVVAREYVTAKEGWPASAYTVENTHTQDNEGNLVVNVIHQDDLKGSVRGGGKSVELHISLEKRRVVKELHFQ